MNKKLSIITINYNNFEGLKKTVESVVNQTWQEFEYIIIDGGSNDGSAAYIESQSVHIDYWVSEVDNGIYNAMNKGIRVATGEYLLFLNSGDHFFTRCSLQENNHYLFDFDLIYFNLQISNGKNSSVKTYPKLLSFSFLFKNSLPHPATFIKSSSFTKTNYFSEEYKIVSDWKFFIEGICKFNFTYFKVDSILSVFYEDGLSSLAENQIFVQQERLQVLNNEFQVFIPDTNELIYLRSVVSNFKKSRKIKWMIRLGLLDKF